MERDLKELERDIMVLFQKPKKKRLRPFVKQITYKGITKKWYEDGQGNVLDFVGKPKIVFDIAKNENETIEDFVKRYIDNGIFK